MIYRTFLQALVLFSIVVPFAYALDPSPQPEISTRVSGDSRTARGSDFMIVTSNSHATKVGYEILKRGGSAADAAIAAHALAFDATLVTADLDRMTRVPGLRIENWSGR